MRNDNMPLLHADFCIVCGTRRTKNPDGICSQCRGKSDRHVCQVCGIRVTSHTSGICSVCRSHGMDTMEKSEESRAEYAAAARDRLLRDIYILDHRLDTPPMSFTEIAKALSLPRSTVYNRYEALLVEGFRELQKGKDEE